MYSMLWDLNYYNGHLPDGLDPNTVYFAITDTNTNATGVSTNINIQVAKTFNDAVDGEPLSINNKGLIQNLMKFQYFIKIKMKK